MGPGKEWPNTAVEVDVPLVERAGHLGATLRYERDHLQLVAHEVEDGGPAAAAGLVDGDILMAIDAVPSAQLVFNLDTHLRARPPGSTLILAIERHGERSDIQIVLGEPSEAP